MASLRSGLRCQGREAHAEGGSPLLCVDWNLFCIAIQLSIPIILYKDTGSVQWP